MNSTEEPAPAAPPVVVARFANASDAEVCRGALEAAGLHPTLADGHLANADWLLITALGGVRICVPEDEVQDARMLLAQASGALRVVGAPTLGTSDRNCPRCGSESTTWFRKRAPLWALLTLSFGIPIFPRGRSWRCASCGHAWDPPRKGVSAGGPEEPVGALREGDERVISAPWPQAGLAWRWGVLAVVIVVVIGQGLSPGVLALAATAMISTVIGAAAFTMRWNAAVLTRQGLRIERGESEVEFAFADIFAMRRPDGDHYLVARGAPIVVGPDAELYAEGALALRSGDVEWLWEEVLRRHRAGRAEGS